MTEINLTFGMYEEQLISSVQFRSEKDYKLDWQALESLAKQLFEYYLENHRSRDCCAEMEEDWNFCPVCGCSGGESLAASYLMWLWNMPKFTVDRMFFEYDEWEVGSFIPSEPDIAVVNAQELLLRMVPEDLIPPYAQDTWPSLDEINWKDLVLCEN